MSDKTVVMMGTPEFAVASLDALHSAGIKVIAVVTAPDRPAGRGKKVRASAMSRRAEELGIATLKPLNLKAPDFIQKLSDLNADLFVVVAFRMLPEVVWNMPPLGTINLHGSLLPNYRGAAPINRAIMNGETLTGATTFFIQQKIDTGDIIDRIEIPIDENDTAGELHDRMMVEGAQLLVRTIKGVFDGNISRISQQELMPDQVHEAPKIHTDDRRLDWHQSAKNVHNKVRGLSPYPGAWTTVELSKGPKTVKILRTRLTDGSTAEEPGCATPGQERLIIACGTGTVEILELQLEGKKAMAASDFLRGIQLDGGIRFK